MNMRNQITSPFFLFCLTRIITWGAKIGQYICLVDILVNHYLRAVIIVDCYDHDLGLGTTMVISLKNFLYLSCQIKN